MEKLPAAADSRKKTMENDNDELDGLEMEKKAQEQR